MNTKFKSISYFAMYISVFTMLGLIFGFLTFRILSFSRTVEVPSLYGKSLLEGNKLLSNNTLYLKIEGEDYDAVVPAGNIIRQDIPAGHKVKERRGIKVVISKGPRITSVPLLTGEIFVNAESLLLRKGLKMARIVRVHSDVIEKDRIIAQKPEPEDPVSDAITVLVSLGPYEKIYYCPDFTGMSLADARERAQQMNMNITTGGSGETVASQKPEPGKQIKTGDTIFLQLI